MWNFHLKFRLQIHIWNLHFKFRLEIYIHNLPLKFTFEIYIWNLYLKFTFEIIFFIFNQDSNLWFWPNNTRQQTILFTNVLRFYPFYSFLANFQNCQLKTLLNWTILRVSFFLKFLPYYYLVYNRVFISESNRIAHFHFDQYRDGIVLFWHYGASDVDVSACNMCPC